MKYTKYILIVLLFASFGMNAQSQDQSASYVGSMDLLRVEPSLASKNKLKKPIPLTEAPKDGRSSKNLIIPGKDKQMEDDFLVKTAHELTGAYQSRMPELAFEVNNNVNSPSDPALAVGLEHVVIVYNTGFIIYDKDGNDLTGPLNVNNIFSNGGCCDLTASYDNAADRWVLSYLFSGSGVEIAVSDGPNPMTADWYVYSIPQMNDYQKLSVWSDGYYMTENTGGASNLWVLEREEMLLGNTGAGIQGFSLPGISTSGFYSPQVLNVTDSNLPAAGGASVVFLQDDAWGGVAEDHIKLWTVNVDWNNEANSTVSAPELFDTTPFIGVFDGGSFANLEQPNGGSEIDALQATIMNQAQFRKFSSHNSAVFNFVVDTDGSAGELAGVRWYEFRQDGDGQPWSMYQEGTYTAPNGKHAWHASMMMDFQGNIGMGYTSMAGPDTPNPSDFVVSSYYTGRYASDPLGTMTLDEELIFNGSGNIGGFRYGDYSKIDLDPSNDKEFWFINEVRNADVVGVFQIASDFANDIGVVAISSPETGALTASEEITVTIFNYGSTDASGFDVTFQIGGGAVITQAYVGTITAGTTAQFTFTTTGDFSTVGETYSITASTDFDDDEFADNDVTTVEVTHLNPIDVGIVSIDNPVSGSGLSNSENVTVSIANFGAATQTNIPVFYTINGGAAVQETFTGAIPQGETVDYTFTTTGDFSGLGEYQIIAGTELAGDSDTSNDDFSTSVENFICQPESNCDGFNDGLTIFEVADQNLNVECGDGGYSDDTDIVFNFILEDNPFVGNLQIGYAGVYVVWIDFDDNYTFSANEIVTSGDVPTADVNQAFEIDFNSIGTTQAGTHIMRVRAGDTDLSGISDPCSDLNWARTNDYTVNITGINSSIGNSVLSASDITLSTLENNQFGLSFNTKSYSDKLSVTVYTGQGQNLAFYTLVNNGEGFSKVIDMSHVAPGVYYVKIGEESLNVVKRIVVR